MSGSLGRTASPIRAGLLSQGAVTREGTWIEKCIVCGLDRWASTVTTGTPCLNCQRNPAGENDGY